MTDLPIIFSAPMVEALLAGRKTETRRVLTTRHARCVPGDRLYVCEPHFRWGRWIFAAAGDGSSIPRFRPADRTLRGVAYLDAAPLADLRHEGDERHRVGWWRRPPQRLPRWASRLTLTVNEVRRQRLGAMTEADGFAEGMVAADGATARDAYAAFWERLHGAGSWKADPMIAVLTFAVHSANIDAVKVPEPA